MRNSFLIDVLIVLMFLVFGSFLYYRVNSLNPFHVVNKHLGIVNVEE